MSTQTIDDVKNLFSSADDISSQASGLMINSLNGTNLVGCMGASVDDIETDDVTVVSVALDASASMSQHEQIVKDSYNKFIDSLKESKQAGSILVSTKVFSSRQKTLHGFKKVEEIGPIGTGYHANGCSTALYDTLMECLTGTKAYATDLNQNGIRTKCIVVVFSDGEDNDSRKNTGAEVKLVTQDLLKSEMFYPVYVGYQLNKQSNLKAVADEVGFPNVLTASSTESEIRRTMDLVSKSVIRASQTTIGGNNTFF